QEAFSGTPGLAFNGEVRANVFRELESILPDFRSFFFPMQETHDGVLRFVMGLAFFVRRGIAVRDVGIFFASGGPEKLDWYAPSRVVGCAAHATVAVGGKEHLILNVHGIPAWPKVDIPARLDQSRNIRAFLDRVSGAKILCGDLNLFPETESVAIIARGMRNLTAEYGVRTTRSTLHYEQFPRGEDSVSDYCFVSPDVTVRAFTVPDIAVSDHLPLILEFA
ncbi:MAG: endonuclease/exonuclease/phosphatase family protein, partial [Patescibacteria group bacterium]